jgi:hypothetical protein
MRCIVDGAELAPEALIYRDLGYGQDPGRPLVGFEIILDDAELIAKFSATYDEFVAQCRIDDQNFEVVDVPEIMESGYADLIEMVSYQSEDLGKIIVDYLYFGILESITKENVRSEWRFSVNQIESFSRLGGANHVVGMGYWL